MDKTIRQILLIFLLIIMLDTVELDLNIKKQKFGIFASVVNVVNYGKKMYKVIGG